MRLKRAGAMAAIAFSGMVLVGLFAPGSAGEEEAEAEGGVVLHVSPEGDDANSGAADAPLATLEAARDRVRAARAAGGAGAMIVVQLHAGVYEREAAFELGEADSGEAGAPVVYRGPGPGAVGGAVLTGGRRIAGFEPVTDEAVLERLGEGAREHVVQADLAAQGVRDAGTLERRGFTQHASAAMELFVEGEPMPLARWPNVGWATIAAAPEGAAEGAAARTIGYAGERPERWTRAPDAWAFGYWHHGWADEHLPIEAIDTAGQRITLGAAHHYGFREGQRFFVYNLLEELDEPGEWYVDRESGTLYFWPPEDTDPAEHAVMVSVLDEPLVRAEGASHVRFEHLTLEGTRDTAVTIRGGEAVALAGCTIRKIGRHGVSVSGGRGHGVRSCDLYHLGERGIELSGGDRRTLTPAGHEVVNNHIHHFSRWARTYRPAVQVSGVGQRVAHNLIHDAPHMAIGFSGNDHRIAHNDIHHVLTETDDAGALYIGRDWTMRGHIIEHNFIHHSGNQHSAYAAMNEAELDLGPHVTLSPLETHGTNLVYLDDAASGVTVRGNVLHDGGRSIMIGGGRDNVAENNLVIGGNMAVWVDARGLGWASEHIRRDGHWGIWRRLEAVGFDEPPYRDRYPGLATLPEEEPHAPVGNRIARNLLVDSTEPFFFQYEADAYAEIEDNAILSGRVDDASRLSAAEVLELARRLMGSAEAEAVGFAPLPLEEIGLFRDEYRPSRR